MPSRRDPRNNPQPGDCIFRLGAKFCRRYRLVVAREGLNIIFKTGATSTRRSIWITSWQEWSAGSDVHTVAMDPIQAVDEMQMFSRLAVEDEERKKADFPARR